MRSKMLQQTDQDSLYTDIVRALLSFLFLLPRSNASLLADTRLACSTLRDSRVR